MRCPLWILAGAAAIAMFPAAGRAQSNWAYGYSHVTVAQSVVSMWGYTAIDYASSYNYTVESELIPEPNGHPDLTDYPAVWANGTPSVGASDTISAADGQLYGLQTNHWVLSPGGDPEGFGTITAEGHGAAFTVYPTGIAGANTCTDGFHPPDCYWFGSTYVYTDTYDALPAVTGYDWTSYANPTTPGGYPVVVLYGTDLTYWAGTPAQTTISVPGVYTSISYADNGQINLEYAIPNGTPAGTIAGTIATPMGSANFNFTVSSGLGSQSISFASIGSQNIAVSPVNVSPTATSGLVVTLSSDTPSVCTVSGIRHHARHHGNLYGAGATARKWIL